jgi:hypothetical protein
VFPHEVAHLVGNTATNRPTMLFLVVGLELVTPTCLDPSCFPYRTTRMATLPSLFLAFKFPDCCSASRLAQELRLEITQSVSTLYPSAASNKLLTICSLFLRIAHIKIIRKVVIRTAVNVYR